MKQLYAGRLILQPTAVARLRVTDPYSIHRLMLDLVQLERPKEISDKGSEPSGLQWVDRGEHLCGRVIDFLTMLSLKEEASVLPEDVRLMYRSLPESFLDHENYRFQIVVNPVRSVLGRPGFRRALTNEADVREWFVRRMQAAGADVTISMVDQLKLDSFRKNKMLLKFAGARIFGKLHVEDRAKFEQIARTGIGKGRAFGYGFLQLAVM